MRLMRSLRVKVSLSVATWWSASNSRVECWSTHTPSLSRATASISCLCPTIRNGRTSRLSPPGCDRWCERCLLALVLERAGQRIDHAVGQEIDRGFAADLIARAAFDQPRSEAALHRRDDVRAAGL